MYVSRFVPKGIVAYCVKATTEVSRNSARNEIDTLITTVSFLVPFKFGKLTRNGIHSGADALTRPSEVVIVVSRHCTTPPAVERTKRTHLVRNGPLYKVKSPCALCRPLYPSISRLFNSQWDSGSRSVVAIIITVGVPFFSGVAASISLTGVLRGHHGHEQGHGHCRPTSTLETNLITLRFADYSNEATGVLLLWTSGRQHVEIICAIPDTRLRRTHNQAMYKRI